MANYRRKYARASKPSIDDVIDLSSLSSSSGTEEKRLADSNDMFNNHAASTSKIRENHNFSPNPKKASLKQRKSFDLKIASDVDRFLRNRNGKKSRNCHSVGKSRSPQKKLTDQSRQRTSVTSSEEYSEDQFNEHLRQCTKCENQIRKCLDNSQCLPYIEKTHSFYDKRRKVQRNNKFIPTGAKSKEVKRTDSFNIKNPGECKSRPLERNNRQHNHHHHYHHHNLPRNHHHDCDDENSEDASEGSATKDETIVEATPLCTIL